MNKIKFGIGFIAGRTNVCNIINHYYKTILKQLGPDASLTFFILYDLKYNNEKKENFYKIDKEVYEHGVKIKYIGEEEIDLEKEIVEEDFNLSKSDVDLFLGYGYCKARNTIMYFAKKDKIDYLLFWDDDEYPVACIKEQGIKWIEQNNIAKHLKYIKRADVTFGYRCGYNSPIPHIDFDKSIAEEDFRNLIDAVSNEAVTWENVKEKMQENGITYASKNVIESNKSVQLHRLGIDEWLLGSGLCLNMRHIEKIPAFYNPPNARGEDTFFSTLLGEAKVYQIPTYHFHDGFLKYQGIMDKEYPKSLQKIRIENRNIETRFLQACIGWIKYKPLLLYITHKQEYKAIIKEVYEKLKISVPQMNSALTHSDFSELLIELEKYDKNVQKHYKEYIKTNKIWNKLKK